MTYVSLPGLKMAWRAQNVLRCGKTCRLSGPHHRMGDQGTQVGEHAICAGAVRLCSQMTDEIAIALKYFGSAPRL